MAKAKITTKSGLTVQVEGSSAEITAVIEDVKQREEALASGGKRKKGRPGRATLPDLIWSLIDGGFFRKKPQDLGAVKRALAEMGHHYPLTSLSGAMLRQVRQRNLRRMRDKKRWVYTG
jgi:hypothetical protein